MNQRDIALSLIEGQFCYGTVVTSVDGVVRVKIGGELVSVKEQNWKRFPKGTSVKVLGNSENRRLVRCNVPKLKEFDPTPGGKQAHGRFSTKDYVTKLSGSRFVNDRI